MVFTLWCCSLAATAEEKLSLEIRGAEGDLKRNIRHHLKLQDLSCDTDQFRLEAAIRRADKLVSDALRALGYYQGSWQIDYRPIAEENSIRNGTAKNGVSRNSTKQNGQTKKDTPKNNYQKCWQVEVQVIPGDPVLIDTIDIEILGDDQAQQDFAPLLQNLSIKKGDQLNHGAYEKAKNRLLQRGIRLGYFDARLTESQLQVLREDNRATIRLVMNTGQRYRFGDVHFDELPLKPSLLRRYKTFESGDYYDADKLIRFQNNLINSQYFESVIINPGEPAAADQPVDIDVTLTLKTPYESTFGAGFSTDIGPRVNYTLKNRRFSADGKTYEFSSLWSPVQQNLGIQLEKPGKDPVKDKTVWSLGWQKEDTDTANTEGYLAAVSKVSVLNNGWTLTKSLSLLMENYDVAARSDFSTLLYPGIRLSRSQANDPAYPTKGWRLAASIKGGVEKVVSDTSFVQTTLDAKGIVPIMGERLIGRLGLGSTFADNFNAIPASLRFFAGGDNSIRGYDFESLGPEDENGDVEGGKHLVTASIEYDHRIYKDYSAAIFFDTGSAFDNSDFTLYESAGFGARWLSPIGPVRLDFAFPFDGGFRLHLSMGPDL